MIDKLQYITQNHDNWSHSELTEQVCKAGGNWVQLRMKNTTLDDFRSEALKCKEICQRYNAKFIINDNVLLAKEINADGVHLGKNDMAPSEARKLLGEGYIIGGTANTFEDIIHLNKEGVDYIGLGPFRFTNTKKNLSPILGLDGYLNIIKQMGASEINIPVVAIGGIEVSDVANIMNTGVHGIAISGLITQSENKTDLINNLKQLLLNNHR